MNAEKAPESGGAESSLTDRRVVTLADFFRAHKTSVCLAFILAAGVLQDLFFLRLLSPMVAEAMRINSVTPTALGQWAFAPMMVIERTGLVGLMAVVLTLYLSLRLYFTRLYRALEFHQGGGLSFPAWLPLMVALLCCQVIGFITLLVLAGSAPGGSMPNPGFVAGTLSGWFS